MAQGRAYALSARAIALALSCAFASLTAAASSGTAAEEHVAGKVGILRGRVCDPVRRGIQGAEVTPWGPDGPLASVLTGADGAFTLTVPAAGSGRLSVRAAGFAPHDGRWSLDSVDAGELLVVMEPSWAEELTVTAARGPMRVGDAAARVVVLDREDLSTSAALTVDDALRQVPGFTLFRRSGSRVANPTAQGASLRGVGPSGSSRTLVLLDGVPLNDAFGGWVYWSRIPAASVERIEVVEGGASELYGSAAVGGVVQALGRGGGRALDVLTTAGSEGTAALSAYGAAQAGGFDQRLAAEAFTTDGYVLVADGERGPVDQAAGSSHLNAVATLERKLGSAAAVFLRGSAFGESRTNGTPLQVNDTDFQELCGGADAPLASGALRLRGWYGTQSYAQTFSAVAADRESESPTRTQGVPSSWAGGSASWSGTLGTLALVAGLEGRRVLGRSDETVFTAGRATSLVSAGGLQTTWAGFVEARRSIGPRVLGALGVRYDSWRDGDGFSRSQSLASGAASESAFEDRAASALSPRASLVYRSGPRVRVFAAGYGAFRSPTLNELYRSFRVGDTLTLANPSLQHERLLGAEAGVSWTAPSESLRLRAVVFQARLRDPVANVTVGSAPGLVTRQRQNLGRTRSRGLELDAAWRPGSAFSASLGYALIDSTVESFDADPRLVGNDVPQVARHQGTLQLRFRKPRGLDVSLHVRASSSQFEDDQNLLPLAGFLNLDLRVARRLGRRLELFAAVENLTGERQEVGRTPVTTLGPPLFARVGLRLGWFD